MWTVAMSVVYTNLSVTPFWEVVTLNILLTMGILSRIIPASALVSAIPQMEDRGAFMSINSSLQQVSGGIAAAAAGMIVVRQSNYSPLQHYDKVGYCVCAITLISIILMLRVNKLITRKAVKRTEEIKQEVLISEGV